MSPLPIDTATLAWVEAELGSPVRRTEPLVGGLSSIVHRCELADGRSVVVRHIEDQDWLTREPDLIVGEQRALVAARAVGVATPRCLATDPDRANLVMSWVPGTMRFDAAFLSEHVDEIARAAACVAATPLDPDHGLPPWRSWIAPDPEPPVWGDRELWARAIEVYRSRPEAEPQSSVLLHRDFHPLNLLWEQDRIVGIVDWLNACVGHPHAELAHCRWNLHVLAGPDVATRFTERVLAHTSGEPYDPHWDLAIALSFLPGPMGVAAWHAVGRVDLTPELVVDRTEEFVGSALATASDLRQ